MKKDLLHTPEGVRDIYDAECARKLVLQNRLRDVCTLYGYNDIQTPVLEFFDVFSKERGSVPSNEMFKLFDRYGNTLVMRPDMTPSIARVACKYYSDNLLPVKLCYVGNTFVNVSKYYQGRLKEITNVGAELIGDDSLNADFEIISMVIDCMKNSGLKEFQVEIGSQAFFNGLLEEAGISGENAEDLVALILEKNFIGVASLLDSLNINKKTAKVLMELPQLFGNIDVLDKAANLTGNKKCLDALDRLNKLYNLCQITGADKYVSFDLGSLSTHSYYTGIVFSAYTFGTGEPVIYGGRYDKLIGQFGCDKPSIGFSINIDKLMTALSRQDIEIPVDKSGFLLVYSGSNYANAASISDKIRKLDIPVCMISYNKEKTENQYCEYAANAQLKYVVFLSDKNAENSSDNSVSLINIADNSKKTVTLADILGGKL